MRGAGQVNTYQNRYEFQGKESEKTFGLNRINLGARSYNPTIGRMDRVDRFADKYLGLSTYQYAANNPMRFIDVNGDSLWIYDNGTKYLYSSGKLYQNGQEYKGKIRNFLADAFAALDKISNGGPAGKSLINDLAGSSQNFNIKEAQMKPDGTMEGNSAIGRTVTWNSTQFDGGLDEKGSTS